MGLFDDVAVDALEIFRRDTVSIYPAPNAQAGDVQANFSLAFGAPTAKETGVAAHIEPLVSRTDSDEGGAERADEFYVVKLAPDTEVTTRPGDRIVVTESDDEALDGATLTVERSEGRTASLSRRLICSRVRSRSGPGAP